MTAIKPKISLAKQDKPSKHPHWLSPVFLTVPRREDPGWGWGVSPSSRRLLLGQHLHKLLKGDLPVFIQVSLLQHLPHFLIGEALLKVEENVFDGSHDGPQLLLGDDSVAVQVKVGEGLLEDANLGFGELMGHLAGRVAPNVVCVSSREAQLWVSLQRDRKIWSLLLGAKKPTSPVSTLLVVSGPDLGLRNLLECCCATSSE
ncbi:uncharacterized protein LOC131202602 [Ahaetulla prasina]|uniref:uncharacterized protein LOC131202602 n=1 Tax=Ahaetulla prasina TaxID=499056 RepID=UPI002647D394|nr:uncharacterized protein LOC131202602 [Ahaetulla prasina]